MIFAAPVINEPERLKQYFQAGAADPEKVHLDLTPHCLNMKSKLYNDNDNDKSLWTQ